MLDWMKHKLELRLPRELSIKNLRYAEDTTLMAESEEDSEKKDHGIWSHQFSSVQFSPSVMSDSWWPHELQHTRLPCPSPTPGVYSNSYPLSQMYAQYIMRNAGLEEAQSGIETGRRNINNLRYADDTTLMAESEKELKRLLSERGEWKSWHKTQHSEN